MCWELIAIFNLHKIRMRVDIFGTEKCKVTFGFKYNYDCFSVLSNTWREIAIKRDIRYLYTGKGVLVEAPDEGKA